MARAVLGAIRSAPPAKITNSCSPCSGFLLMSSGFRAERSPSTARPKLRIASGMRAACRFLKLPSGVRIDVLCSPYETNVFAPSCETIERAESIKALPSRRKAVCG